MVTVRPADSKSDINTFIKFPWKIYRGEYGRHPAWVPPLIIDRKEYLNKKKNPFFGHSEVQYYLAEREGKVVGRIAAIHNTRHLKTFNDNSGFFGFFECIDDQQVANALLDTAAAWVKQRGLGIMRGPANFTLNEEPGLLLNAYDMSPMLLMAYNPPYYIKLLENYGCVKSMDLLAYRVIAPPEIPTRMKRANELALKRANVTIRTINMKKFKEEVDLMFDVHREAFAENWGEVPMTREEIQKTAADLKMIADPDIIFIAESEGKPVGICVCLPDMNQVLHTMNGRLFPTGIIKLLTKKPNSLRVMLLGVLDKYRRQAIDAAMVFKIYETSQKKGYTWGEMSWILEVNTPMRRIMERIDGEIYKTYRLYEKSLP